jgi:hypothetical protein
VIHVTTRRTVAPFCARWALRAGLVLLGLATATGPVFAQGFQGTVTALVKDTQGAAIPGANATLRNQGTNETREQVSGSDGLVVFPNLLIGQYSLTVELSGFKTYERRNIGVRASQQIDVNVTLEVGGIAEVINVQAESDLVDVRSSQLEGASFDAQAIRDVPAMDPFLDGDPTNFSVLAPGVGTQPGGVVGQGGVIGGNRPRQNNFVVDGLDNNDPSVTGPLVPVIADAVAEFTLLTNQFNAEFGHSTAGQFITTMKSGTNAFHGGAWGYAINRHFNSLDNLTRATADEDFEKPRYDRQRVGGQLGGPILRDRWFFYGAYEYRNLNLDASPSGQILVPTSGGLSLLQSLAQDPTSGVSPLNVGLLQQYVPTAGATTGTVNVLNEGTGQLVPIEIGAFSANTPNFTRHKLAFFATDYQASNHRLSARLSWRKLTSIAAGALPTDQFNSDIEFTTKRGGFSWVWSAKPNLVNEFRAGYTDNANAWLVPGLPDAPSGTQIFGNYSISEMSLEVGPQSNYPQSGADKLSQVSNTTTWIKGAHTFKGGVEWRHIDSKSDFLPRARGDYVWANLDLFARDAFPETVAIRGVGKAQFDQSRSAFYGFLQDSWRITPQFTLDLGVRYEWTGIAKDSELQDLNTFSSIFDMQGEVDADGDNIFNSLSSFHQQRLLSYIGNELIFRKPNSDKNNFSPRIGFAWDINGDGRQSLRGGFAWTQDVIFGNLPLLQLPPQAQAENRETNACLLSPAPSWCAVGGGGNPGSENIGFSTIGFLNGGALLDTLDPAASESIELARLQNGAYVRDDVAPETLTWTVSYQRELARDFMAEVRYIGTHGRKLPIQRWVSAGVLPTGGSTALGLDMPIFADASEALATSFAGAPTRQDWLDNRVLLLEPYGFGGVITEFAPLGESWYHGGSIVLTKRFSNGWAFNANYTLSKATDWIENDLFTSFLNPRRPANMTDPSLDKGESGLSKRHKFALSWQWDIPGPEGGLLGGLLSNWSWNGMFLFETGQFLTMIARTDINGDFDSAGDRVFENPNSSNGRGTGVNYVCWTGATSISETIDGCGGSAGVVGYVAQDPGAQYVNPDLGAINGMGLVPTSRGNYAGPGNIHTVNTSLYKTIPLGGSRLRLGVQVLNLTNTPSFALGTAAAFSSTTAATGNPGFMQPSSPQFLDETIFSGSLGQNPFQRIIQFEARWDF